MAASALDSNIQHAAVVNEGGQRVITIVTDQHGNLQTTGGMTQPFFVTMQHGQQSTTGNRHTFCSALVCLVLIVCLFSVLAVPANTVTEEVVTEEPQPPPSRKRKLEMTNNHSDGGETVSGAGLLSITETHRCRLVPDSNRTWCETDTTKKQLYVLL